MFWFYFNSQSFKTKHQLKNHSIMHEENYTPFLCSFCPASFRRKSTLNVHMRSHTNLCPYTCRYCGKSFRHGITLQVSIWYEIGRYPLNIFMNCSYFRLMNVPIPTISHTDALTVSIVAHRKEISTNTWWELIVSRITFNPWCMMLLYC